MLTKFSVICDYMVDKSSMGSSKGEKDKQPLPLKPELLEKVAVPKHLASSLETWFFYVLLGKPLGNLVRPKLD